MHERKYIQCLTYSVNNFIIIIAVVIMFSLFFCQLKMGIRSSEGIYTNLGMRGECMVFRPSNVFFWHLRLLVGGGFLRLPGKAVYLSCICFELFLNVVLCDTLPAPGKPGLWG